MKKTWKLYSGLGGLVLVLAIIGVWLFGGTSVASASERAADDLKTLTQSTTGPGLFGDGYLAHGGWEGRGGFTFPGRGSIDYQKLLADALGITVDELQAAFEEARTAAIEQAVDEGLITREQADEMLVWGFGTKGFGGVRGFGGPMGRGWRGISDGAIDGNALVADALGITVEELDAARDTANQAAIDQALEEGLITQEQADQMRDREEQMQVRKDLQSYLDRDTLLAKALGMTVEELQAALAEGKSLSTLMGEKGLDAATVRQNLQAAYEAAIAQAVEDGVITQEQADQMQSGPGMMPGGGRGGFEFGSPSGRRWGPMGRDGFRGHGGFGGWGPCPSDTEDTSGARFSRPARTFQGGSAL
jgi:lambda repressor-like predicted transcriptional regulator